MWENRQKSKYVNILMNNQNVVFGLSLPYGKNRKPKNVKQYILINIENNCFDRPLFYLGNILYSSKILRALLSNKIVFVFLQKFNNSIATKLRVTLINKSRNIFENYLKYCIVQWLNCVVSSLNMKLNWKLVEKSNAHFWSALKW